jgi:hypothetical protein
MDAFLDALQGKNGKSQEYQIRDNDAVENRFEKILSGTDCVAIDINGFSKAAPKIITRIRQYYSAQGKKSDILLYSSIPCEERQILGCLIQEHIAVQKEIPSFKICSHVFDVPGEKFEQMWIDSWCNVILNEHDFLMCQAYQENYRLFQMYFKDRLVELIKNADVNE